MAFPVPWILSPALPSELLTYILQHEVYPTTLIICSPRTEFLSSLTNDIRGPPNSNSPNSESNQPQEPAPAPPAATSPLLSSLLYQIAIARHIRVVFIPTVSHLRAYLSVFRTADESSKVGPPPTGATGGTAWPAQQSRKQQPPLLLVYGFLALHRDTSEWSAQGISGSAAALLEASRTSGLRAVVVDPPTVNAVPSPEEGEGEDSNNAQGTTSDEVIRDERILAEEMPVLRASVIRAGGDFDDAALTGRKVTVGRALGRWFRYKAGQWYKDAAESE